MFVFCFSPFLFSWAPAYVYFKSKETSFIREVDIVFGSFACCLLALKAPLGKIENKISK